jgi:phage protein U
MPNIPEFHLDLLGRKIFPGDFVVSQSWGQSLGVFTVERLTEKMGELKKIKSENYRSNLQRYPDDCLKVEGSEVTFFLLQNSKSS